MKVQVEADLELVKCFKQARFHIYKILPEEKNINRDIFDKNLKMDDVLLR